MRPWPGVTGTLIALLVSAGAALADEPPPDCQCRMPGGQLRNLGTVLCLDVTSEPVMMRCEMSTNTPYWKPLGDGTGCAPT